MNRNRPFRSSLLLLTLPLCLCAASGPGKIEKTFATTSNPHISIFNLEGKVIVRGWDKAQVHVLCSASATGLEVDSEALPAQGAAEKLRFSTQSSIPRASGAVDYILDVPQQCSLDIHNPQGHVEIEKVLGDIRVESVAAPITVTDAAGHVALGSVGGDITVIRPSGRVEVSSVTGNLRFVSPSSPELDANTSRGLISYDGDFPPGSDYHLRTYSGSVDVRCPASASFELRARSMRGKVENAIALEPTSHQSVHFGNSLFGRHSTGRATLELRSYRGNIFIHP